MERRNAKKGACGVPGMEMGLVPRRVKSSVMILGIAGNRKCALTYNASKIVRTIATEKKSKYKC